VKAVPFKSKFSLLYPLYSIFYLVIGPMTIYETHLMSKGGGQEL
jgi:hypothetical protein